MTYPHLHEAILKLYQGCRDCPASDFKEYAMEAVRRAVPFDSGIWVSVNISSEAFRSVFLFRQPPEMMENYARVVGIAGDLLGQTAAAQPGRTINSGELMPRDEFIRHPVYALHCRPYGMEHALSTCHMTAVTGLGTLVSFFRADPGIPFGEDERRAKEVLVPHMIEAMRINLFTHLHGQTQHTSVQAVCDSAGMLYETTPSFPDVIRESWPGWTGPRIPLPVDTLAGQKVFRWSVGGLKFEAAPCRDLYLINVVRENALDRLSPRQYEIAEMLAMGKRYKDIARHLAIAPSTVTNHVNQIHSRLGIESREALISLFKSLPFRH